jgi:hypothetical protein
VPTSAFHQGQRRQCPIKSPDVRLQSIFLPSTTEMLGNYGASMYGRSRSPIAFRKGDIRIVPRVALGARQLVSEKQPSIVAAYANSSQFEQRRQLA